MTIEHYLILAAFMFTLGASVGSFLNVCICRIPRRESLVRPKSRCPRCLKSILARDNLPVLGWLLLRGRCRSCSLPISTRYPMVEALVGLLFVAIAFAESLGAPDDRAALVSVSVVAYQCVLAALLVTAAFITFDCDAARNRQSQPKSP
jgi:leader peptidase (prepilin peptidase) / N-methyltransferase